MAGFFLDTSVVVYAFTHDRRAARAEELLALGGTTSVQVLNEFANVARRRLGMTWREVSDASAAIRILCAKILGLDVDDHAEALRLADARGLSIDDALVLVSALRGGCEVLYIEDMQGGMLIDGRLRLVNPF